MERKRKAELEADYNGVIHIYESLSKKLESLLGEILNANEIPIHSVCTSC